jgi:cytochrome c oxidase subunit IV
MLEQVKKIMYKIRGSEEHVAVGHVVPLWLLASVALALVALTWVTVAVTYIDLGKLNLVVALLIAGIKAFLVALFFMHLRWDRLFNGITFLSAIAFVVLFISFALMDTAQYKPEIIQTYEPAMERAHQAREQAAAQEAAGATAADAATAAPAAPAPVSAASPAPAADAPAAPAPGAEPQPATPAPEGGS